MKKYELIINADTIRKYFYCFHLMNNDSLNVYVFCHNNELFEIISKLNVHYFDYYGITYGYTFIFTNKFNVGWELCDGINGIDDDEHISFEFETEEEMFYFKLKYC